MFRGVTRRAALGGALALALIPRFVLAQSPARLLLRASQIVE
jgi:hypothetical protein